MPVRKFRSIEAMKLPRWYEPGTQDLFRAMRTLWDLGCRTSVRHYPPGVHKHVSIQAMQRVQEKWARR